MLCYITVFHRFLAEIFQLFLHNFGESEYSEYPSDKDDFFLLGSGGANMFSFKATNEIALSQQFILSVRFPLTFLKLVKRHILSYTLLCH